MDWLSIFGEGKDLNALQMSSRRRFGFYPCYCMLLYYCEPSQNIWVANCA